MNSPSKQVTHEVISHDIRRVTVADISLKYHRKFRRYHRTPAPQNIWRQLIIVQTYPAPPLSPLLFFHPLLLCRSLVQRKSGLISSFLCCRVVLDGSMLECHHGCKKQDKKGFELFINNFEEKRYLGHGCLCHSILLMPIFVIVFLVVVFVVVVFIVVAFIVVIFVGASTPSLRNTIFNQKSPFFTV